MLHFPVLFYSKKYRETFEAHEEKGDRHFFNLESPKGRWEYKM